MSKWEMVRLGDVCLIERGGSPRPIDKYITNDESGVNWIKIGDTFPNNMYITKTKEKIIKEGVKKSRIVKKGDFLLSNSMSFGRPYILKIDGCIHDGWLLIRDEKEMFDKRFLYYYLSSEKTYSEFKNLAVGGVVNNLNSAMVRQLFVPLPPLPVQQKIADVLDCASVLIEKRKAQIAKLDLLVKAHFFKMFGDPVTNPMGWEKKELSQICENLDSKRIPITSTERNKGSYPYYGASGVVDFVDNFIFDDELLLVSEDGANLLARVTPIAFSVSGKIWVNNHAHVLKFHDRFTQLYVEHHINFIDISNFITGTAQPKLNQAQLNSLSIPLPPLALQNRFADFVRQVEKEKAEVQRGLDKLELFYKSLMQKCFEGEVGLV